MRTLALFINVTFDVKYNAVELLLSVVSKTAFREKLRLESMHAIKIFNCGRMRDKVEH